MKKERVLIKGLVQGTFLGGERNCSICLCDTIAPDTDFKAPFGSNGRNKRPGESAAAAEVGSVVVGVDKSAQLASCFCADLSLSRARRGVTPQSQPCQIAKPRAIPGCPGRPAMEQLRP
jgi:hypothetical protein